MLSWHHGAWPAATSTPARVVNASLSIPLLAKAAQDNVKRSTLRGIDEYINIMPYALIIILYFVYSTYLVLVHILYDTPMSFNTGRYVL